MKKTSLKKIKPRALTSRPAPSAQHTRVVAAAREGVHAALLAHKKAGHHVVVVEDGKVVRIPPRKISV
jgi:hypothetical protein